MRSLAALILGVVLTIAAPATAADMLDFEGVGDSQAVDDFYAPNFFFYFTDFTVVDADAGGTGENFENEPSPSTILLFFSSFGYDGLINAPIGFTDGFSFFYSSRFGGVSVWVYDDLNFGGNVLALLNLAPQSDDNCENAAFCNWTPIGATFAGTARSIRFESDLFTAYDNLTFGSATPIRSGTGSSGPAVPEPAAWTMLLLGFVAAGAGLRRARRRQASTATRNRRGMQTGIPASPGFAAVPRCPASPLSWRIP